MNQPKLILISTLTASLLVLAGCTAQTSTNTLPAQTGNVEVAVNTNTDIDTSDWLTYTNEEYGFSVNYPSDWIFFNKINGDEAIYDPTLDQSFVRFTNEENRIAAYAFVDITLTISETLPNNPTRKYVENNGRYYIFSEGTWPNEESLYVMEQMIQSIEFGS